jgi:hypothetical protein
MAVISQTQLLKVLGQSMNSLEPLARRNAEQKFNRLQRELIEKFEDSPVTKEIEAGENGSVETNISGTLGGKGNLWGFIGFEQGSKPIAELRELLDSLVFDGKRIKVVRDERELVWYFLIDLPDDKDIQKATPMPWLRGASWAMGIEKGITGLTNFIYTAMKQKEGDTPEIGRSGQGLQAKRRLRTLTFSTQDYIFKFIRDLRKEL